MPGPYLGHIPVKPCRTVRLSFENKITGKTGAKTRLGIDVIDDRGWHKTKSGFSIDSIAGDVQWQQHTAEMASLPDCRGMIVSFRLISEEHVNAKVEIRNLRLSLTEDAPPYPALTSFASLSTDRKTLYLIVFNKHHESAITATLEFPGEKIKAVKYEAVSVEFLDALLFFFNK